MAKSYQSNEHGRFEVDVIGRNIIRVDAEGPYNLPIFARYHEQLVSIVNEIDGPWHHMSVLRGESIFTPEVSEALVAHMQWWTENNCVSDAVIWVDAKGTQISQNQLQKIYDTLKINGRFFTDMEEALSWTRKQVAINSCY